MLGKLAIVVGHSLKQKGAKAVPPIDAYEYDYNNQLASIIYRAARQCGIECRVFLRDKIGIKGAYEKVNAWIAEDELGACIELHFNAFNGKAKGTETLFDMDPADSIELARCVHNEICNCFSREGKANRGIKKREEGRGAYNLELCEVPGCIVEPFFGDTRSESELGHALMFEYAGSILKGVQNYFKETIHRNGLN